MDKKKAIHAICVFCSSSSGNSTKITESAVKLGRELADRSIRLVYGGSNMGLMGTVARSVLVNGGEVTGIIPKMLQDRTEKLEVSELLVVDTMHQRKSMMFENADAFIALPGGIGTLEETAEMFTWLQLGYSSKPVGLLNACGYYDNLLAFFDTMVDNGMLKAVHRDMLLVSDDPAGIIDLLDKASSSSRLAYHRKW